MKKVALFFALTVVCISPTFAQFSAGDLLGTWESSVSQPLGSGEEIGMSAGIEVFMVINDVTTYQSEGKSTSSGIMTIRFVSDGKTEDANFSYDQKGSWSLSGDMMESKTVDFGGFVVANDRAVKFNNDVPGFIDIMNNAMVMLVSKTQILHLDDKELRVKNVDDGSEFVSKRK